MAVKPMVSSKKQAQSDLDERVKKATSPPVNLNPVERVPAPPPKEEEIVPDLTELISDKGEQKSIRQLVSQYLGWAQQSKEAEREKKSISTKLKTFVGNYGIARMLVDGNNVSYFNAARSTIKAELLLQHGISPQVIEACTVTTDAYTLRITPPRRDE